MPENTVDQADGIHASVPSEAMCEGARKLRAVYERVPGAPLYRREFGFYCLERWEEQGMPQDVPAHELFSYDPGGAHSLGQLGWCEAAFAPGFETKVIEARDNECEVAQDSAGRHVLYFKGRRSGFMPEYLEHPVKDMKTWEENVSWRLDPNTPERYATLEQRMTTAEMAAGKGMIVVQNLVGGYMYLRSLIGPEDTLYVFYDQPELIHACITF